MALVSTQSSGDGVVRRAWGTRTGTRTEANFTITLGFAPVGVKVMNLTDRVTAIHYVDSALDGGSNAKSVVIAADGTTTYEAAGIAVSGRTFTVTVATKGLATDNDDTYWEAWA